MSYDIVKIFSLEEFDFLISGQNQIDINDWRANTIYKGMYSESHKVSRFLIFRQSKYFGLSWRISHQISCLNFISFAPDAIECQ
jgi:hypothetical protein